MLLDEFLKSSELYPDKVALNCRNKKLTFSEIDNAANSLCNALILIEEGFHRQDRAVVYLHNPIESVLSIFRILKAGGIFVIVDPHVKARKFDYIFRDCGAQALITNSELMSNISEVVSSSPNLERIIATDYEKTSVIHELITEPRLYKHI
jgi:long-chain acyl-CoA synthetase